MVNDPHSAGQPASRDAGLRRLARITRWTAAGAITLTGALTKVAADAFPGHQAKHVAVAPARAMAPSVSEPQVGEVRPPEDNSAPVKGDGGSPNPPAASASQDSGTAAAPDPSANSAQGSGSDPNLSPPAQAPAPSTDSGGASSGGS